MPCSQKEGTGNINQTSAQSEVCTRQVRSNACDELKTMQTCSPECEEPRPLPPSVAASPSCSTCCVAVSGVQGVTCASTSALWVIGGGGAVRLPRLLFALGVCLFVWCESVFLSLSPNTHITTTLPPTPSTLSTSLSLIVSHSLSIHLSHTSTPSFTGIATPLYLSPPVPIPHCRSHTDSLPSLSPRPESALLPLVTTFPTMPGSSGDEVKPKVGSKRKKASDTGGARKARKASSVKFEPDPNPPPIGSEDDPFRFVTRLKESRLFQGWVGAVSTGEGEARSFPGPSDITGLLSIIDIYTAQKKAGEQSASEEQNPCATLIHVVNQMNPAQKVELEIKTLAETKQVTVCSAITAGKLIHHYTPSLMLTCVSQMGRNGVSPSSSSTPIPKSPTRTLRL